jgi:DNA gyrase inhibitor GyrI
MIKWFLGTVLGVVLGISGYFLVHLGAFKSVLITEKTLGPLELIYKDHMGAYHKVSPLISEVETWAKSKDLNCTRTFGEYFDDPRSVEEGRLRARVGCVVDKIPENLQSEMTAAELKTVVIPEGKYVTAVFEGSPAIGPMKVYPKIEDYFAAKGLHENVFSSSVLEIYVVHSETAVTTTYLFPIK